MLIKCHFKTTLIMVNSVGYTNNKDFPPKKIRDDNVSAHYLPDRSILYSIINCIKMMIVSASNAFSSAQTNNVTS